MNDKRYNLLVITPDQMRADYLSCYGHSFVQTAHIDKLAERGTLFERAYCAYPWCAPSRASFVSGTYPSEHGVRNNARLLDARVPNFVAALKMNGYRTGLFGKNHTFQKSQLPDVYDTYIVKEANNMDHHPDFHHSFSAFEMSPDDPLNLTEALTTHLLEFIGAGDGSGVADGKPGAVGKPGASGDQPFFAWINYQDPHPAFTCPEPYYSLFDRDAIPLPATFRVGDNPDKPIRNRIWQLHSEMELATEGDVRKAIATYCGQIRYVDDQVGRIMRALEEKGLLKSTIVVFFSDHGELLGDHGMFHKLAVFYEGVARIPLIMVHPDSVWRTKRFAGLVEEVDLAPTLLEAVGVAAPPTMVGRSWHSTLLEGGTQGREDALCEAGIHAPTVKQPLGLKLKAPFPPTAFGTGAMLRTERYKLCRYADDTNELYDLQADPLETNNLYSHPDYAAVRAELTDRLVGRLLAMKMRDVGIRWPGDSPDPRTGPLTGV